MQGETDAAGLRMLSSRISPEPRGASLRIGRNRLFDPPAFPCPLEGAGRIRAVYPDDGRPRQRNRLVRIRC